MEDKFVPYKLVVKLNNLGFICTNKFKEYDSLGFLQENGLLSKHDLEFIPAPIWDDAFEWFRKEYKLLGWLSPSFDCYNINIVQYDEDENENINKADGLEWKDFSDYDEARLECLTKMIEIIEDERLRKDTI